MGSLYHTEHFLSEKHCRELITQAMEEPYNGASDYEPDHIYRASCGVIEFLKTNPMLRETLDIADATERNRLVGGIHSVITHAAAASACSAVVQTLYDQAATMERTMEAMQEMGVTHPILKNAVGKI